jgi:hypothetical protein
MKDLQSKIAKQRNEIARLAMAAERSDQARLAMVREVQAMRKMLKLTLEYLPDDLRRSAEIEISFSEATAKASAARRAA